MPELPNRHRFWYILTPWKYATPFSRIIGFSCLALIAMNIVAVYTGLGDWYWYLACAGILMLLGADMLWMRRDTRRYKQDRKALRLWSQVIDGKIAVEDLTPEQQEEIAMQRAKVYVKRK